jgi:hypothetical protein
MKEKNKAKATTWLTTFPSKKEKKRSKQPNKHHIVKELGLSMAEADHLRVHHSQDKVHRSNNTGTTTMTMKATHSTAGQPHRTTQWLGSTPKRHHPRTCSFTTTTSKSGLPAHQPSLQISCDINSPMRQPTPLSLESSTRDSRPSKPELRLQWNKLELYYSMDLGMSTTRP